MEKLHKPILEGVFTEVYCDQEFPKTDWQSINLTCKTWHQIAYGVLQKVNFVQAFSLALYSPFTCSGELPAGTSIQLRTDAGKVVFPPTTETYGEQLKNMKALESICKQASFGRGAQEVLDPNYRDALVLDPENFSTNFHPSEFNILNEGGFFNVHKDTPRGANHIGSLVVVLPFPHEGGKFIVKQGLREEILNTSWTLSEKGTQATTKWIAFFGDCDHWIEPVTAGYRITLTYHLFTSMNVVSTSSVIDKPIYSVLSEAIKEIGKKFGFFLRHEYSSAELKIAETSPLLMLRGADAVLYSAAISLGLKAKLRAIFRNNYGNDPVDIHTDDEYREEISRLLIAKSIPKEGHVPGFFSWEREQPYEYLSREYGAKLLEEDSITWLSPIPESLRNLAGSAGVSTGNEPSNDGFYYQAILLLSKPDPDKTEKITKKQKRKESQKS